MHHLSRGLSARIDLNVVVVMKAKMKAAVKLEAGMVMVLKVKVAEVVDVRIKMSISYHILPPETLSAYVGPEICKSRIEFNIFYEILCTNACYERQFTSVV